MKRFPFIEEETQMPLVKFPCIERWDLATERSEGATTDSESTHITAPGHIYYARKSVGLDPHSIY